MDGQLVSITLILLTSPPWAMAPEWPRAPVMTRAFPNVRETIVVGEPGSFQPLAEWPDASRPNQPISEPAVPLPVHDRNQGKAHRWGFITIVQTSQENASGWTVQWNVNERLRVGVTFNYFGATNFVTLFYLEIVPSTNAR